MNDKLCINEYNQNKSIYIQTIVYYKLQYNRKEEQSNGDNVNQIDFQTEKYRQSTFSMQITLFQNLRQYRKTYNIGIKIEPKIKNLSTKIMSIHTQC